MSITIVDRTGTLASAGHEHCERRLRFALSRFDSRIQSVEMMISDENGPKNGADDKLCVVTVRMNRLPKVVVRTKDGSLRRCISRAADRTGRAVARSISRSRSNSRRTSAPLREFVAAG